MAVANLYNLSAFRQFLKTPRGKKILPSPGLGREHACFVVPPKFGEFSGSPLFCAGSGLRGPAISAHSRLIRTLGGRPSRVRCKSLSAKRLSLCAGEGPVLLPRHCGSSDRFFVFHHHTPIQIAALQPEDQHFCRGQIGRAGDVVRIAQAERAHDALIL